MRQLIQSYKNGELWLADVPIPVCKPEGVIVKTVSSFVSAGTERMLVGFAKKNIVGKAIAMPDQVKLVLRKMKTEGVFETLEKVQAKLDQPIPLGYSCSGVVVEVGNKVNNISIGNRVACAGAGYANHSEYNYIPKNLAVKISDSVSFEDAACATVGSIALQGVRQCDLKLGESACVLGLGLLGILAIQMLKASGVKVIGYDPSSERCALAKTLGADLVVSENLEKACEEFSEGYGVDAVLITAATKSNEPVTVAGEICRVKGKVVVTGLVGMDIPRDMYYKKELDFKLSLSYGPGRYDPEYEEAGRDYPYGYVRWTEQRNIKAFVDMIASGCVTPSRLVTHRFRIDDALQAYDLMMGKSDEPYLGIVLNYPETNSLDLQELRRVKISEASHKASEIRVGFIGAGNFTKAVLFPSVKKQGDIALKGICAATGMSAEQSAKTCGFEYATTDYKQILDDPEITTVFITTRHNTHANFVKEALGTGKHVFVEKPLCLTEAELAEIISVYNGNIEKNENGKADVPYLMVGFNRRFSPHAQLIRHYFENRRTPMLINYRVNAGIIPPDVWIQDPDIGGGRIIGEVCHFIDFSTFLIGSEPSEVHAMCSETSNTSLVQQDNITISIRYQDGSVAQIFYVAVGAADLSKEYCEVFADESTAIMNNFCSTVCMGKRGPKKLKGKQEKGFVEEIASFFHAIRHGGPAPIEMKSLVSTTASTFAALESLRSRQVIKIDQGL